MNGSKSVARTVLIACVVALAVTACGRRGPLEAPPHAGTSEPARSDATFAAPLPQPAPGGSAPAAATDRPFILDALL